MAWLPGISPGKAVQLVDQVLQNPRSVQHEAGLPSLAHANLMAAAFEAVDAAYDPEDLADFIHNMVSVVDELSAEEVLRDINEDRAVSGFPEVRGEELIERELTERKRYYRAAIRDALNRLPAFVLVDVMTRVVDDATEEGEYHAPDLLDDLVDTYEVEAQDFLQREAENVHKLIAVIRELATQSQSVVDPAIEKLEVVTRNWDRVAQPIQLSFKARGQDHSASKELAHAIRSLAIDLFNEHDMLGQSQRLTGLLEEVFAELPQVAERAEEDAEALEDIFHQRRQVESRRDEWAREISYHTHVGTIFKSLLSISPDGVSWNDQHYPLDSVTRVRWGGTRHSVNGIPTGTSYTIAFGDDLSEAVVDLKSQEVFSAFVDKLFRAVGIQLLTELLETLAAGREVRFGEAVLRDTGVTLPRRRFLSANEPVHCSWHQTHIWTADGFFFIGAQDDKKVYAGFSYIHTPNIHILEQAIRMAFKRGSSRLSDVLRSS
jgi:hypothetical protein